jgi:hypothetical protein
VRVASIQAEVDTFASRVHHLGFKAVPCPKLTIRLAFCSCLESGFERAC